MHQSRADAVASGLGFFSIALGLTEIVAPRLVKRAAGMRCSEGMVRLHGVREIATGLGLLLSWKRAPWVWGRVAGDAIDIASARRPAALVALAGVTALDITTARQLSRDEQPALPYTYHDYSDRSGFPRPAAEMRGVGRIEARLPT
jgi:uncharacterized protein YjeT (DUF2065 family)